MVSTAKNEAAHSIECAAPCFLRLCLRIDGIASLWARPLEPRFLQPARRISKTKKLLATVYYKTLKTFRKASRIIRTKPMRTEK
jgi:hypothetical protein